jgi:antitoxin (DNA-binding transcriptional repressor) of toxin-antitoxin stability system
MVAGGESVEVTDRGRPVAMLVPVHGAPWDALLASGRVLQPDDGSDLTEEPPVDYRVDASSVLRSMRDRER